MNKEIEFLKSIINKDDVVVVACSGGPDSMCLLSLVNNIKSLYNLKVIVAHVNHKVRIESNEEAIMVQEYCNNNDLIFELFEINEYKNNKFTESDAREKRYNFFKKVLEEYQAKILLTAHHGDDLIETILMRLTRGSNLNGYIGIRKVMENNNYKIIRPLLTTDKKHILKYLEDNNIDYAIDETNNLMEHTRNRYRHIVLPFLKKENPSVHEKYLKFSEELINYDNFVNDYIESKKIIVDSNIVVNKLEKETNFIKKKCLEIIIKEIQKKDDFDISDEQIKELMKLYEKQNISIDLHNNYKGYNSYGKIFIKKTINESLGEVLLNGDVDFGKYRFFYNSKTYDNTNCCICLCREDILLPLKVRTVKVGDKMEVKNLNGTKKVSDIFIDEKVPKYERESYPLVVDSNDKIIWIPNLKKSKFAKDKSEKYDIIIKCEAR